MYHAAIETKIQMIKISEREERQIRQKQYQKNSA